MNDFPVTPNLNFGGTIIIFSSGGSMADFTKLEATVQQAVDLIAKLKASSADSAAQQAEIDKLEAQLAAATGA